MSTILRRLNEIDFERKQHYVCNYDLLFLNEYGFTLYQNDISTYFYRVISRNNFKEIYAFKVFVKNNIITVTKDVTLDGVVTSFMCEFSASEFYNGYFLKSLLSFMPTDYDKLSRSIDSLYELLEVGFELTNNCSFFRSKNPCFVKVVQEGPYVSKFFVGFEKCKHPFYGSSLFDCLDLELFSERTNVYTGEKVFDMHISYDQYSDDIDCIFNSFNSKFVGIKKEKIGEPAHPVLHKIGKIISDFITS